MLVFYRARLFQAGSKLGRNIKEELRKAYIFVPILILVPLLRRLYLRPEALIRSIENFASQDCEKKRQENIPMQHSLAITISNAVRIWAPGISTGILEVVKRRLTAFDAAFSAHKPEVVDIRLKAVRQLWQDLPGRAYQMDALYGFWATEKDGCPVLVFLRRGVAVVSISFGEDIVIEFVEGSKVAGTLFIAILYCVRICLQSQDCLLVHGAAYARDNRGFMVLGPRGIRKTALSLEMLHRGWHYIADDKFILRERRLYRYQREMLLRDHHFEQLPWLAGWVPSSKQYLRFSNLRKRVRAIARRFLHRKLLPNEDRLLNRGMQCAVGDLFPGQVDGECSSCSAVFLLRTSESFAVESTDTDQALPDVQALQRLANDEFNAMDDMLSLLCKQRVFVPGNADYRRHFPEGACCYSVGVPDAMGVQALAEELCSSLDRSGDLRPKSVKNAGMTNG